MHGKLSACKINSMHLLLIAMVNIVIRFTQPGINDDERAHDPHP